MDPVFTGVGVALVTLFDAQQELDADATAGLAVRLVELGADAIVVAGTTGEADALDDDERLRLFSAVRAAVGDTPVIGGTGAASTHQAVRLTARAPDTGVDALIARTPRGLVDPTGLPRTDRRRRRDPGARLPLPSSLAARDSAEMLPSLPVAGCKDSSATRPACSPPSTPTRARSGRATRRCSTRPGLSVRGRHPRAGQRRPRALRGGVRRRRRRDAEVHPDPPRVRARLPPRSQLVAERFGTSDVLRMG